MLNKINYKIADRELFFIITKFKAMEALDFILNLINNLPENISLPDGTTLQKYTIKTLVLMVMDVGDNEELTELQKDVLNNAAEFDLLSLTFKEAYLNASIEKRTEIRNQLIKLLKMENGEDLSADLEMFIKTPKEIFNALVKIVKFNYQDFFLVTET